MKTFIISLRIFLAMTILTGIIYPLIITAVAQLAFPRQANGSLVKQNGRIIGSELIGQPFDSARYFWPRPSEVGYNPLPSGGSNLGPTSRKLKEQVEYRKNKFLQANGLKPDTPVPSEMLCASGSGLDPHIPLRAALLQVNRIAEVRKFNNAMKQELFEVIKKRTETPQFYILGEQRINVLMLNLDLDKIK